jgi:hypothetical protein
VRYINVPQRYPRTAGLVHRKYPDFCVQYKENHARRRPSGHDSVIAEGTAQAGPDGHRRRRRWLTLTTFLADPPRLAAKYGHRSAKLFAIDFAWRGA